MTDDVTAERQLRTAGSTTREDTGSEGENGGAAFDRWCAETGTKLEDAGSARVDVYCRSMLPPPGAKDAQVDVMSELDALCDSSPIEDVTINVWGERICLCDRCRETETGRRMLETVRQLEQWGGQYGASTESFFERTRQRSSVVGSVHEGITPPRVTAALYVDGSIEGVFPARFEDECYSVHDFVESVARETDSERPSKPIGSTA